MARSLIPWLSFALVLMVLIAGLIISAIRVDYRLERCAANGVQRTIETGTAWLNPLFPDRNNPLPMLVSVDGRVRKPTRIEQDFPEAFTTDLGTEVVSLETTSWLIENFFTTPSYPNPIVDTYEVNPLFRAAIQAAVREGRLNSGDLSSLTWGFSFRAWPGKDLVMTLLSESSPRPALPAAQSAPSSPVR